MIASVHPRPPRMPVPQVFFTRKERDEIMYQISKLYTQHNFHIGKFDGNQPFFCFQFLDGDLGIQVLKGVSAGSCVMGDCEIEWCSEAWEIPWDG